MFVAESLDDIFKPKPHNEVVEEFKKKYLNRIYKDYNGDLYIAYDIYDRGNMDILVMIKPYHNWNKPNELSSSGIDATRFHESYTEIDPEELISYLQPLLYVPKNDIQRKTRKTVEKKIQFLKDLQQYQLAQYTD